MNKKEKEFNSICPAGRNDWRQWLKANHLKEQSVWLICYKKDSAFPTISHSEAVDEALCYGWIDSTRKTLDKDRFMQYFCKRKPGSVWSKINKGKVKRLIKDGLMMPAGLKSVNIAKQNGSWTILDEVEEVKIPQDLTLEFKCYPGAKTFFLSLSRSAQKVILQWLVLAKRPETRTRRIREIAELASQKLKPRQFRT